MHDAIYLYELFRNFLNDFINNSTLNLYDSWLKRMTNIEFLLYSLLVNRIRCKFSARNSFHLYRSPIFVCHDNVYCYCLISFHLSCLLDTKCPSNIKEVIRLWTNQTYKSNMVCKMIKHHNPTNNTLANLSNILLISAFFI